MTRDLNDAGVKAELEARLELELLPLVKNIEVEGWPHDSGNMALLIDDALQQCHQV